MKPEKPTGGTFRVGGGLAEAAPTPLTVVPGPRLQTYQPSFADHAQRVAGKPAFRVTPQPISPELVERAITVATVFGRPGDFAEFEHDFTGEMGQVQRAAVAVRELLLGRSPPSVDPARKYVQLAEAVLGAISGTLARNVRALPHQLFDEFNFPSRGLVYGRTSGEYIAAGLRFLLAMAYGNAVRLHAVVRDRDVATLVALIEAAQLLKGKPLRAVLGRPLSFVRVADSRQVDSWNGCHWVKATPSLSSAASDHALATHMASRSELVHAALADIVHGAAVILRDVAPQVAGRLTLGSITLATPIDATLERSRLGYPFARTYSVSSREGAAPVAVEQLLSAKTNDALVAANRLGGQRFDDAQFQHAIERLLLGGFVDTAHSRQRAVEAAEHAVGAHLDGLERIQSSGRRRDPQGKADTDRLWFQLDELLASLASGPLADAIAARFAAIGSSARIAALARSSG